MGSMAKDSNLLTQMLAEPVDAGKASLFDHFPFYQLYEKAARKGCFFHVKTLG
jgi:hypothetical protein